MILTSINFKHLHQKICFNTKLFVCILLFIIISLNSAGYISLAATTTLSDIQGHWAQTDIQKAVDSGYIKGYSDLTFRPDNAVTRAEFVSMLNSAFSIPAGSSAPNFKDVQSSDWFADSVYSLANAAYINGYPDNTFRPNDYITREQCALVIYNITTITGTNSKVFEDSSQIADWSRQAVEALAAADVLTGYTDGFFYPAKNVTRAQAVVMINRAKDYISNTGTGGMGQETGSIQTTPVQVSLLVTGSQVNIRSLPDTSYPVIGQVNLGDVLRATELSSNNWYKVEFNGATGWITAQYVKEDTEVSRGDIDRNNEGNEVINYVWIWRLPKCEGGDIDALIQKAKALHIGYVIKTHDGNEWWQEQADAITKITAAGVPCGAWGYCYGNHVQDEINNVQASFEAGASFYVADVEKEYGNINMRDTAQQFMSAISRFGPIDYTSYAYPTYHSSVPFDIFNQYARYAIPQCYWKYIGDTPQECYNRAVREYAATGAKNIAPMGMMCDNVSVDEIKQFKNLCGNSGNPIFWWDYQEATPQMLDALLPDPQ